MMKKTFRKSLALLLSLMMVVSVFSAGMFTVNAVTTQVMLNNCDSASGWEPFPGDNLELTTAKKTEGTGAIHTWQGGGFTQGGPIAGLNLTGIESISFDFAANTAEALSGPSDVAFYLFSGDDYIGYQELNEVDTSKVLSFNVAAIRAGYGKSDESFATITAPVESIGENFDITNVTGFYFWGCTDYSGDHEQWLDNVVANISGQAIDAAVTAVNKKINALPETVTSGDRIAVALASVAYNALTDAQKAQVDVAVKAKLDAAVAASKNVADPEEFTVMLNNCDDSSSWWTFDFGDGEYAETDTEIKTEGTGSFKYHFGGGVGWGASVNHVDITGIKSLSFDIASDNDGILTQPTERALLLFSRGNPGTFGFQDVFNGDGAIMNDADLVSKIMQFNVEEIAVTLPTDGATFTTVTATPTAIGENFDYTDITGFQHWSCANYPGSHTQWIDNVRVNLDYDDYKAAAALIDALPTTVTASDKAAVEAARAAYDALSDVKKALIKNYDKLTAAEAALSKTANKNEVLLDDGTNQEHWAIGGDGSCFGEAQDGHIWFWWLARTIGKFDTPKDITGARQLKIDFTRSYWDGDGTEWSDAINKDVINGGGEMGIALTSYTGTLPSGTENAQEDLVLSGEAWTDYAVRVKATSDIVKGMNTFEIDYTTAGAKFDPSAVTAVAIVGKDRSNNPTSTCIYGVWAVTYPDVANVTSLIAALPQTISTADKAAIENARAAYEALSTEEKAYVDNYSKLTAAEAALKALISGEGVLNVTLGSLTANPGQSISIPLTLDGGDVAKKIACFHIVVNYDASVLTPVSGDGFFTKSSLIGSGVMLVVNTNTAEVGAGKAEIVMISSEAIGTGNYGAINFTVASGAAAGSSTTVSLTACEDTATEDLIILDDVRTTASTISIVKATTPADEVIALINAIGTPITLDSESKITAARKAYDALSTEEKGKVTNYAVLTAAETELDNLKKIATLENLIKAIGTIGEPVTAANRSAVSAARTAYDALSTDLRARVSNYATLTAAEAAIKAYDDRMAAVQDVIAKIAALPDADKVALTDEAAIVAARNAYNALSTGDMNLVTNITRLTAAELALAELKASSQKVKDCIEAIANLPDPVALTDKDKVAAARNLYDALSESEKTQVINYNKLTGAETTIANLEAIKAVEDKIAAIGTLGDDITTANRNAITAARAAYDALAEGLRPSVKNYADLTAAEYAVKAYDARMAKVNEAIDAIKAIGTIGDEVTEANRSAVAAAEAKVAAVDARDTSKITNMDALNAAKDAIKAYDERMKKVDEAIAAIKAIGTIGDEVTDANRSAVANAEAKVAAVDARDTDKITNIADLDAAKAAIKAYDERMKKVEEAIAAIDAIGTIGDPVTDANRSAVANAEEKVAAVDARDTSKITNAKALEDAKNTIAANDKRAEEVEKVIGLINKLDSIKYPLTDDMRNDVKAARNAFDALDETGKARVTNKDRLTEAEELVKLFDNLGNVDEADGVTTSDALMVLQFVVKTREFSEWQAKIADVNGDGKVTAVDALLILQYATGKITSFPYNK